MRSCSRATWANRVSKASKTADPLFDKDLEKDPGGSLSLVGSSKGLAMRESVEGKFDRGTDRNF